MCGLVGVVGHIDNKSEKMFQNMLRLDTMRGGDSTGIFSHKFTGQNMLIKEVGTPWELEEYKCWDTFFSGFHKVLMGHNRAATRGKVTRANAHPFEFDVVVGAHNGTLRGVKNFDNGHMFDVDSEALFSHMNTHGAEETIKVIDGAFALSWFNKVDKTFHLVRNKERPLSMASINDGKALAYASEAWMLRIAAGYAGVVLGEIVELPVGEMITINMPEQNSFNLSLAQPLVISSKSVEFYDPPKILGGGNIFEKKRAATHTTKGTNCHGTKNGGITTEFIAIFEIVGDGRSNSKQRYLEGEILDADCDVKRLITDKIRIFPQYLSKEWNSLFGTTQFIKARVKHFSDFEGGYYTVDLRSIEYTDDDTILCKQKETCHNCGDEISNTVGFMSFPTGEKICGFCAEDFRKHAANSK